MGNFEFVIVAALRSAQLMRGCTARVACSLKKTTTARHEVASGKVSRLDVETPRTVANDRPI
jgi:hypothetical protein